MEGPHDKECKQPPGAKESHLLTANKEMGTSVLQAQDSEFCQ